MAETKATIRVIKKTEIDGLAKPVPVDKQPNNADARRLVANVLNWISDLETRKLEETRVAVERFRPV